MNKDIEVYILVRTPFIDLWIWLVIYLSDSIFIKNDDIFSILAINQEWEPYKLKESDLRDTGTEQIFMRLGTGVSVFVNRYSHINIT